MALVTVTGNAWTHQGEPVSSDRMPELWFRPKAHAYGTDGLLLAVEAKADLDTDGSFTVELESEPGVYYQPVMRWLLDPSQTTDSMDLWAWRYAEWPFLVVPGDGGAIQNLINAFPAGTIIVSLGPPLPTVTNVAWIDLTDQNPDGALVYAPGGGA